MGPLVKGPYTYDVSHQGGGGESADFKTNSDKGGAWVSQFLIVFDKWGEGVRHILPCLTKSKKA